LLEGILFYTWDKSKSNCESTHQIWQTKNKTNQIEVFQVDPHLVEVYETPFHFHRISWNKKIYRYWFNQNNISYNQIQNALLVGGLEHFSFFHTLGIIIPTGFHIFQRGWAQPPTRLYTPERCRK
jgi:hypothetical protein